MKQFQKEITSQIINALKKGVRPWKCPFERCQLPVNFKTKKQYQGINILYLWLTARLKGFTNNYWLGFAQARSLNAKVKKGSKGTQVIACFPKKKLKDGSDDEYVITPFFKVEKVFNLDQVEGLKLDTENNNIAKLDNVENFLKRVNPKIIHKGERAFYDVTNNYINMPYKSKFKNNEGYYSTLFHELIHWTGQEICLDRFDTHDADSERGRAFEELVAEIGASFLCANFGITPNIQNTSNYVGSWLKELENDTNYIFKACKEATFAINFLLAM